MVSKKDNLELPLRFKVRKGETIVGQIAEQMVEQMAEHYTRHSTASIETPYAILTLDIKIKLKHGNEESNSEDAR